MVATYYYIHMYIFIIIAIGQVTGVTLTCEPMDQFDYNCTVMWNVSA